jgi:hypothetical protein
MVEIQTAMEDIMEVQVTFMVVIQQHRIDTAVKMVVVPRLSLITLPIGAVSKTVENNSLFLGSR